VECRRGDVFRFFADQFSETAAHLSRCLARERDRKNAVRRRAPLIENVRDAIGQRARLAAPRAGENQQRSIDSLDGFVLLVIQRIEFEQ
jgi:hypothetical protein